MRCPPTRQYRHKLKFLCQLDIHQAHRALVIAERKAPIFGWQLVGLCLHVHARVMQTINTGRASAIYAVHKSVHHLIPCLKATKVRKGIKVRRCSCSTAAALPWPFFFSCTSCANASSQQRHACRLFPGPCNYDLTL